MVWMCDGRTVMLVILTYALNRGHDRTGYESSSRLMMLKQMLCFKGGRLSSSDLLFPVNTRGMLPCIQFQLPADLRLLFPDLSPSSVGVCRRRPLWRGRGRLGRLARRPVSRGGVLFLQRGPAIRPGL